jgi:hypothetical protein
MPENLRDTLDGRRSACDACLIMNKRAAVVFAPPSVARNLYDQFRNSGLPCSHLPGDCGTDVIDLGKPSANQERLIRTVFASWRKDAARQEPSSLWCVWLSLLVVALWVVALLVSW